jgi:hypothetical protein
VVVIVCKLDLQLLVQSMFINIRFFPNLKNNWKYVSSLLESVVYNTTGNHIPDTGILSRAFNTFKSRRLFLISFMASLQDIKHDCINIEIY